MKFQQQNQSKLFIIKKKEKLFLNFSGQLGFIILRYPVSFFLYRKNFNKYYLVPGKTNIFFQNLTCSIIKSVCTGYKTYIEIFGTGYKISSYNKYYIQLDVGFSHAIKIFIPNFLQYEIHKNKILKLKGIDLVTLTQFTAKIRNLKKPEIYKGKGIRYIKEVIRLKQGKKKKK